LAVSSFGKRGQREGKREKLREGSNSRLREEGGKKKIKKDMTESSGAL